MYQMYEYREVQVEQEWKDGGTVLKKGGEKGESTQTREEKGTK